MKKFRQPKISATVIASKLCAGKTLSEKESAAMFASEKDTTLARDVVRETARNAQGSAHLLHEPAFLRLVDLAKVVLRNANNDRDFDTIRVIFGLTALFRCEETHKTLRSAVRAHEAWQNDAFWEAIFRDVLRSLARTGEGPPYCCAELGVLNEHLRSFAAAMDGLGVPVVVFGKLLDRARGHFTNMSDLRRPVNALRTPLLSNGAVYTLLARVARFARDPAGTSVQDAPERGAATLASLSADTADGQGPEHSATEQPAALPSTKSKKRRTLLGRGGKRKAAAAAKAAKAAADAVVAEQAAVEEANLWSVELPLAIGPSPTVGDAFKLPTSMLHRLATVAEASEALVSKAHAPGGPSAGGGAQARREAEAEQLLSVVSRGRCVLCAARMPHWELLGAAATPSQGSDAQKQTVGAVGAAARDPSHILQLPGAACERCTRISLQLAERPASGTLWCVGAVVAPPLRQRSQLHATGYGHDDASMGRQRGSTRQLVDFVRTFSAQELFDVVERFGLQGAPSANVLRAVTMLKTRQARRKARLLRHDESPLVNAATRPSKPGSEIGENMKLPRERVPERIGADIVSFFAPNEHAGFYAQLRRLENHVKNLLTEHSSKKIRSSKQLHRAGRVNVETNDVELVYVRTELLRRSHLQLCVGSQAWRAQESRYHTVVETQAAPPSALPPSSLSGMLGSERRRRRANELAQAGIFKLITREVGFLPDTSVMGHDSSGTLGSTMTDMSSRAGTTLGGQRSNVPGTGISRGTHHTHARGTGIGGATADLRSPTMPPPSAQRDAVHRLDAFAALSTSLSDALPQFSVPQVSSRLQGAWAQGLLPGVTQEMRRAALDRFINRIHAHPVLSETQLLERFLGPATGIDLRLSAHADSLDGEATGVEGAEESIESKNYLPPASTSGKQKSKWFKLVQPSERLPLMSTREDVNKTMQQCLDQDKTGAVRGLAKKAESLLHAQRKLAQARCTLGLAMNTFANFVSDFSDEGSNFAELLGRIQPCSHERYVEKLPVEEMAARFHTQPKSKLAAIESAGSDVFSFASDALLQASRLTGTVADQDIGDRKQTSASNALGKVGVHGGLGGPGPGSGSAAVEHTRGIDGQIPVGESGAAVPTEAGDNNSADTFIAIDLSYELACRRDEFKSWLSRQNSAMREARREVEKIQSIAESAAETGRRSSSSAGDDAAVVSGAGDRDLRGVAIYNSDVDNVDLLLRRVQLMQQGVETEVEQLALVERMGLQEIALRVCCGEALSARRYAACWQSSLPALLSCLARDPKLPFGPDARKQDLLASSRVRRQGHIEIDFKQLKMGRVLGKGSFGEVRKAKFTPKAGQGGMDVAVKYCGSWGNMEPEARELVESELRLLRNLPPHPNVLRFHGVATESERTSEHRWFVMELVDAGTLHDLVSLVSHDMLCRHAAHYFVLMNCPTPPHIIALIWPVYLFCRYFAVAGPAACHCRKN